MKYSKFITLTMALTIIGTSATSIPLVKEKEVVHAEFLKDGRAYVQYGITNRDLETIDGYRFPAGTRVARADRDDSTLSGSFSLKIVVGLVFFQTMGIVDEQYVTIQDTKIIKPASSGTVALENKMPPSAVQNALVPAGTFVVEGDKGLLKETVTVGEEKIATGLFTDKSCANLRSILTRAYKVIADPKADQAKVDAMYHEVSQGLENLQVKTVVGDKKDLKATIKKAKIASYNPNMYTSDTFQDFEIAFKLAEDVYNNPSASQRDIDRAVKALKFAYGELELSGEQTVAINKSQLQDTIKNTDTKLAESSKYTDNTLSVLRRINDDAKEIFGNTRVTQQQVDTANTNLQNAINGLKAKPVVVIKKNLKNSIDRTNHLLKEEANYTKETFNVFKKSFDQATRVLNDSSATQAQVDAADKSLTNAFKNLKKSETPSEYIDKIGLGMVIHDAKIYEKDDRYTKESRDKLVIERQKAEKVMKNEKATQAEVDKMTNSLRSAFKTVLVEVSKTKPEGNYIKDGRYVTYSNKNYNTYSNFGWKHRQSGSSLQNKTFQARGKYNHQNGSTYLSLYDNKGTWYGYVNEKAVRWWSTRCLYKRRSLCDTN